MVRPGDEKGIRCGLPVGAKSVTAPATVSGERRQTPTGLFRAGKDGKASTRKSGDLPSNVQPTRGGASWKEALMARLTRVYMIGTFCPRLATSEAGNANGD